AEEFGPEADEPARGHDVLHADPAGAVVHDVLHPALAQREQLRDDPEVVLGRVDRDALDRLVSDAVDLPSHDLGLADGELEALTTHHLDEHGELKLATALDLPLVGPVRVEHADRDVADDLLVEAPLHETRGDLV